MAITLVGVTTAIDSVGTINDLSIDLPGASPGDDIAANDVAIITNYHRRSGNTLRPTGFDIEREDDENADSTLLISGIYSKVLTGAETTITQVFDPLNLDSAKSSMCFVYRGANTAQSLDVAATYVFQNDSTPNFPAITPTSDNGAVLGVQMVGVTSLEYTALANPATPALTWESWYTTGLPSDQVAIVNMFALMSLDYGTAGALTFSQMSHTYTGTDFALNRLYSIALRPAPVDPTHPFTSVTLSG